MPHKIKSDKRAFENARYAAKPEWYKAKAAKKYRAFRLFIDRIKAAPCTDCHQIYPPWGMKFDHVRGEKKFQLGDGANHGAQAVMDELSKCELVCSNCHAERTHARRLDPLLR